MIRILVLFSANFLSFYCQSDNNIETSVADPVFVTNTEPLYYDFTSSSDRIDTSVAPPVLITTTSPIYYDFTLPDIIDTSKAPPVLITTSTPIYFDFSSDEPQTSIAPPPDLITTTEQIYFDFSSTRSKLNTLLSTTVNPNQTLIQLQRQINQIPKLNFSGCNLKTACTNMCTNVTVDLYSIKDFGKNIILNSEYYKYHKSKFFKACLNFELITNKFLVSFQLSSNITMNNQTVYSDVISGN